MTRHLPRAPVPLCLRGLLGVADGGVAFALATLILAIALGDTEWIIAGAAFVIFGAGLLLRWNSFSRTARR